MSRETAKSNIDAVRHLDLESLHCFLLAGETLNFRAAAARAHLSPPAFSERITALEDTLGSQLFERVGRGVKLTSHGERLIPMARRCLNEARSFFDAGRGKGQTQSLEITLGAPINPGLKWLLPALPILEKHMPEYFFHLRFAPAFELLALLLRGDVHAVVSSHRSFAEHLVVQPRLVHEPIHDESYELVAQAELLQRVPFSGVEDAVRHTLVDETPNHWALKCLLDALSGSTSLQFGQVRYLGIFDAVYYAALHGLGVAVLPTHTVGDALRTGDLVRLLPELRLANETRRMLWLRDHPYAAHFPKIATQLRGLAPPRPLASATL